MFQRNCNRQVFILKLRVANYELNLHSSLVKSLLSHTLELQVAKDFYKLDFSIGRY